MLPHLTLIVSIVALVAWAFLIFGGVTTQA